MCISSPLKLLRWLILLGSFSFLSACGEWFDSDDRTSQTAIQTEALPSDSFANATIVTGTDSNGVGVEVIVESSFADDVTMSEGLDPGLPDDYQPITNGFIQITVPPEVQGARMLRVTSPAPFEVIVGLDEADSEMSYTPFLTEDDGTIVLYLAPINGSIAFALMDVPEY